MTTKTKTLVARFSLKMVREASYPVELEDRCVTSAVEAAQVFAMMIADADREHVLAMALDTKGHVNGVAHISTGTLDASLVHPRETFKFALLRNAQGLILAHNHPSGDPTPSAQDRALTTRIATAGVILGVRLLDHLVIGANGRFTSLAETEGGLFE